ncbi:DUF3040 domain-containing protein [Nonomuraea pusilla]|nr:DUF3040 domain-containing protein [Nonomuraea pusilla]
MSLSGKERRILAEIEQALEQEDPEMARRVAAINWVESGGEFPQAYGARLRVWVLTHVWTILTLAALTILLLFLAVLTS